MNIRQLLAPFGDVLSAHIKERGWSRCEFARRAGLSESAVRQVAHGGAPPPLKRIEQWADILELHGEKRDYFLDLAALACAPERVIKMFDPKHPAFPALCLAMARGLSRGKRADLLRQLGAGDDVPDATSAESKSCPSS